MLTAIVQHSQELVAFISALNIALYQPQIRHLIQMVDALLVSNETKTISGLYRLLKGQPDPKSGADFFRESPWRAEEIGLARKGWMVKTFLDLARKVNTVFEIFISIDDSLGKKGKATRHLEAVDYQHNHTESSRKKQVYTNGFVYVEVHVQIGPFGFLFDTRLYLREKTVRHLNRKRPPEKRLRFRTKYALARAMLVELTTLLPKGHKVYVLFDSWYASRKLIKFCRRQKWHVICAIKSNRRINKVGMSQHNQTLRHRPYERVTLEAVDEHRKPPRYYTRYIKGYLEDFAEPVHAIISKTRPGDKFPKYFVCTDLSLSVQQVLRYYQKRWSVEVDNLYLKNALGLGDFRLRSFEAIQKWFAVVMLAINYLQYRMALAYKPGASRTTLADFIRLHRLEHFQHLLRSVLQPFAKPQQIEICMQEVFTASPWAII
ncbi:MAG: transposase [Anaerolineales bacterium]|jgi:hypothetical protein